METMYVNIKYLLGLITISIFFNIFFSNIDKVNFAVTECNFVHTLKKQLQMILKKKNNIPVGVE